MFVGHSSSAWGRLGSPTAGAAQVELVATNLRSIKEARNESVALCTRQASK